MSTERVYYASADTGDANSAWSVYVELYDSNNGPPIEGSQRFVAQFPTEQEANRFIEKASNHYAGGGDE